VIVIKIIGGFDLKKKSWVWWYKPVIPATQEATGRSPSRPAYA
jgi:hypothetical protein